VELTENQIDFCAGTALVYMGPDGPVDEYVVRLRKAMEAGDAYEAEHITALMVVRLIGRDSERGVKDHRFLARWWSAAWKGAEDADLRDV